MQKRQNGQRENELFDRLIHRAEFRGRKIHAALYKVKTAVKDRMKKSALVQR